MKLIGSIKSLEKRLVGYIPQVNEASVFQRLHRSPENAQQVLTAGKVLDHRIEDDRIERPGLHTLKSHPPCAATESHAAGAGWKQPSVAANSRSLFARNPFPSTSNNGEPAV